MEITIGITCPCGQTETRIAKRTVNSNKGRVFEDYSDIEDGFEGSELFEVSQSHPDAKDVRCLNCGTRHEIS